MNELTVEAPWIDYATQRPTEAAIYQWRVLSVAVPGLVVTFLAWMREERDWSSLGYNAKVPAGPFAEWDKAARGYVMPEGTQWRVPAVISEPPSDYEGSYSELRIDGRPLTECPFCHKEPFFIGICVRGGRQWSGAPWRLNNWWIGCCEWTNSPHMEDPRELEKARRAAIAGETEHAIIHQ